MLLRGKSAAKGTQKVFALEEKKSFEESAKRKKGKGEKAFTKLRKGCRIGGHSKKKKKNTHSDYYKRRKQSLCRKMARLTYIKSIERDGDVKGKKCTVRRKVRFFRGEVKSPGKRKIQSP